MPKVAKKIKESKETKSRSLRPKVKPAAVATIKVKPATKVRTSKGFVATVGRRKSAVARVRLFAKGSGQVIINDLELTKYFVLPEYHNAVLQPLRLVGVDKTVDLRIKVTGGGKAGQAVAVRHGVARALLLLNEDYRQQLRPAGFLTRDARVKERKKPGLKRARRAPQFSKR